MAIRMKDIAEALGVSTVTVSKALRHHPDISEPTRERVLRYMREVNFQPNVAARTLATGRSFLIGLVVPDLLHPFFAEIGLALSGAVRAHGYSVLISSSENDPNLEVTEIRHLLSRKLDALVIASCGVTADHLQGLDLSSQKIVMLDRRLPGMKADFIGTDDEAAGFTATEHLIQSGCQRIAHIMWNDATEGTIARMEGYKAALRRYNRPIVQKLIVKAGGTHIPDVAQGSQAMQMLLQLSGPRIDGVFCFSDPLAMGAMGAILDAGLRIPEDIAIIGCGNLHYDDLLRVPLSSMDQQSALLGQRTAKVILDLISARKTKKPSETTFKPSLVTRASSMKKNR